MALTDFKVFDTSVKEKARIKRVSNGKFVVTGGCENSRVAVSRYLKTLAFIDASSGALTIDSKGYEFSHEGSDVNSFNDEPTPKLSATMQWYKLNEWRVK